MSVLVELVPGRAKEVSVDKEITVADLLKELGINKETVIVLKGKTPVPESARLKSGDSVKIMKIISGG